MGLTVTATFKAVCKKGALKPIRAKLRLKEDESVWVTVSQEPVFSLIPTTWEKLKLEVVKRQLKDLPRLKMDDTMCEERERY